MKLSQSHLILLMKMFILFLLVAYSTARLAAQTMTTLVQFDGTNGSSPFTMIQGSDGNFYGLTAESIFKMSPQGSLTTLTNLQFVSSFGVYPMSGLIQGKDGNFYGVRGFYNSGTNYASIFKMAAEGSLTVLTNFEVAFGAGGLTQGSDGNFYGAMQWGMDSSSHGSIFKMTPDGALTTLVNFNGTNGDVPNAPPIQANDGNFYGTTVGSDNAISYPFDSYVGTIYKMTPDGTLTTLFAFDGTNGISSYSCLIQANDGNLYGTTDGTIFKTTLDGTLTTLATFNITNGSELGSLIQASDGNFYGTASVGGNLSTNGYTSYGTIFKMTPDGTLTTLFSFNGTNGYFPYGSLVQATDGNLYGVTSYGGNLSVQNGGGYGDGTVFKITGLNLLPSFQSITLTNGNIRLAWNSVSNWTYRVQYKTNLTDASWTDLPGDVLATNVIAGKTDPATPAQRFYRLVLLR